MGHVGELRECRPIPVQNQQNRQVYKKLWEVDVQPPSAG